MNGFRKLFLLFLIINIIIKIKITNSLTGCESLSHDLCLSAYPMCMSLILTSCCPGQSPLCLEIDTVINYLTNKKQNIQNCLRNLNNGILYELWGDMEQIPGYEIIPIPNITCLNLGCENKGFNCKYQSVANCQDPESLCCKPIPVCTNFTKNLNEVIRYGTDDCFLPCPDQFICKVINGEMTCLPTNCSLIQCPDGTTCLPLTGLNTVSCYKTIDSESPPSNETCETVGPEFHCPRDFICGESPYSNTTCVPNPFDTLGNDFLCEECPPHWLCRKFGFDGFCIEFENNFEREFECFGRFCLSIQFCNQTSQQCEYERCTNTTCVPEQLCVQNSPTSPRICIGTNIIPVIEVPRSNPPQADPFFYDINIKKKKKKKSLN
ncbi:hypothetical protein ACTFIY_004120 [Dictyostelium cf. discoideum]